MCCLPAANNQETNMYHTTVKRFLSLLLAITVLLGGLMSASPAAAASNNAETTTKQGRYYWWQMEREGKKITVEDSFYRVRGGDTMTSIARSYGVTLEALAAENPQIDNINVIGRGELVRIPKSRAEIVPLFYRTPAEKSTSQ
jgi:spore germination protein YaaH